MREFTQYVIYSIIGAVIFLAVYSIWLNPSIVTEKYEDVKEFLSETGDRLNTETVSGSDFETETISDSKLDLQDDSVISCLNEIKQKTNIFKEKAALRVDVDIGEYRKFDNTNDAISYLDQWGYIKDERCLGEDCYPNQLNTFSWPDFFKLNYTVGGGVEILQYQDIVIILTKFETTFDGQDISSLSPLICIDGEMTESSLAVFGL